MMFKGKTPLIVAVLTVLAGFGYLIAGGLGENLVWNLTPNELLAKGDAAYGHPVRLGGQVVPGTVVWDEDRLGVRFSIRDTAGPAIAVQSAGAPSAMFREGIGVIVEGKLVEAEDGAVFHSNNLMVKHSNEYQPPGEGGTPKDAMYRTLIEN